LITEKNIEWFPRLRTFSLHSESTEDEQKDLRLIQKQLAEMSSVMIELKKQVSDLSDENNMRARENAKKLIKKNSYYK